MKKSFDTSHGHGRRWRLMHHKTLGGVSGNHLPSILERCPFLPVRSKNLAPKKIEKTKNFKVNGCWKPESDDDDDDDALYKLLRGSGREPERYSCAGVLVPNDARQTVVGRTDNANLRRTQLQTRTGRTRTILNKRRSPDFIRAKKNKINIKFKTKMKRLFKLRPVQTDKLRKFSWFVTRRRTTTDDWRCTINPGCGVLVRNQDDKPFVIIPRCIT
jgi:hypothetical protein